MFFRSFVLFIAASAAVAANVRVRRQILTETVPQGPSSSVGVITASTGPGGLPTSEPPIPITTAVPIPASARIHPNGVLNKCLDVAGNKLANGTPVQIYDCNGTGAQNWIIQPGSTSVRLSGTNFCLDAGSNPGNGVEMKIWTCFDDLPAQAWFFTADLRIALENKGLCLDLPSGNLASGTHVQTWQCTDNNTNQVWSTSF